MQALNMHIGHNHNKEILALRNKKQDGAAMVDLGRQDSPITATSVTKPPPNQGKTSVLPPVAALQEEPK